MGESLVDRLRAHGYVLPDYDGGGLVNVASTVLDVLVTRDPARMLPAVDNRTAEIRQGDRVA